MKSLIQILLTSSLVFSTYASFAAPAVSCPPTTVIATAKFVKARRAFDYHWEMISKEIAYSSYRWNVYLLIKLPNNVTNPAEALRSGQAYFDSKIQLAQPVPLNNTSLPPNENHPLTCSYDAGVPDYGVLAQSPPMR